MVFRIKNKMERKMEVTLRELKELLSDEQKDCTIKKEEEKLHHLIGKKVLIRTYSAGVHFGTLREKNGIECILENSIRIWKWDGAATLSQLSIDGVSKSKEVNCKFAMIVPSIDLQWIEILPCSKKSISSITGVEPWTV